MNLDVKIAGPGQDDIEAAAMAFMREQFDAKPSREERPSTTPNREGGALAMIALLMTIPGTVLAAMQIADKLELKKRLERLLGRVSENAKDPKTSVLLTINGDTTLDLKTSSADQIIITLETSAKKEEAS